MFCCFCYETMLDLLLEFSPPVSPLSSTDLKKKLNGLDWYEFGMD